MYSLLVAATVLFTVQFLFQQQYCKSHGAGLEAMLNFSFCTGCIGCLLMLVLNGFHLRITAFAVGMAIAYSVSSLLNVYFALKAFTTANLSVFSVFSMLGGMLLPLHCRPRIVIASWRCLAILCPVSRPIDRWAGNFYNKAQEGDRYG